MSWQSWDKSDWSQYGRRSSWESWDDSQGWSQSPRTPPRKAKAEDYGSPQGSASRFSVDVPGEFCQTRDFLDTREVYGLKFPKKIQPSAWAMKHQLAGREVTSIQLREICWQGWNNYSLRALAQGRYVSVNFARSIEEATFISFMLQKIRESKLDLDSIAENFCTQSGVNIDTSEPDPQQKSLRMRHFVLTSYSNVRFFNSRTWQTHRTASRRWNKSLLRQSVVPRIRNQHLHRSVPWMVRSKAPAKTNLRSGLDFR